MANNGGRRSVSITRTSGLVVPAGQRDRPERACRYALRPPVTNEQLHLTAEGQVRLELRQPWRDGTTDVVFDPVELLEVPPGEPLRVERVS